MSTPTNEHWTDSRKVIPNIKDFPIDYKYRLKDRAEFMACRPEQAPYPTTQFWWKPFTDLKFPENFARYGWP